MSTKIKLMRRGKTRQPYYRIVVADSRTKRDGRSIEEIGKYHPKEDPSFMQVDAERVAYWLGVGAQPTDAVRAILRVTGDWQKFYGEPEPEPMKVKAAAPDRRAAFEAATQLGGAEPLAEATTPKKKATKAEPKVEAKGSEPEAAAKTEAKGSEPKVEAKTEAKGSEPKVEAKTEAKGSEPKAEAKTEAKGSEPKAAAKTEAKGSEPATPEGTEA